MSLHACQDRYKPHMIDYHIQTCIYEKMKGW